MGLKGKIAKAGVIVTLSYLALPNCSMNKNWLAIQSCYAQEGEKSEISYEIKEVKVLQPYSGIEALVVEKRKDQNEDKLAGNIPVEASSDYIKFRNYYIDDKIMGDTVLTKTDSKGIAHFNLSWDEPPAIQIDGETLYWYFDKDSAFYDAINSLEGAKQTELFNALKVSDFSYGYRSKKAKVDIKCGSESREVYITGIIGPSPLEPIKESINNLIKKEIEAKYKPRSLFIKVVGEDLCPLNDSTISFAGIKTLTLDKLTKEVYNKKKKYIWEETKLFNELNIGVSYLISDLDGKEEVIPEEGLEVLVNVPSEYEISIVKRGYEPIRSRVKFTESMKGKMDIKMTKLGKKVRFDFGGAGSIDLK